MHGSERPKRNFRLDFSVFFKLIFVGTTATAVKLDLHKDNAK